MEDLKNTVEQNDEEVIEGEVLTTNPSEENAGLESLKDNFGKLYKKYRTLNLVVFALVMVVVVLSYILLFPLGETGMWAGIITIIISLIISYVFSQKSKRKITQTVKDYMRDYNAEVNTHVLKDSTVYDYKFDFEGRIDSDAFVNARLLKDIVSTNSRNLISYDINNHKVEVADYVAYRTNGKRNNAVFLGKLVTTNLTKKIDGRIIVYIKPNPEVFKESQGPDDVDDLQLIQDDPRFLLYATNTEIAKGLNKKALDALLAIQPDIELADAALVMYDERLIVSLSYSDKLMVVPFREQKVPFEVINSYKEHITAVNNFITLL